MTDLIARLDKLSPAKRLALEKMLLEQGRHGATRSIPQRSPDEPPVLSFAEQRLWFVDQLEPNHPFYNMPLAARLRGPLSADAFARALQQLVERHESLRTSYAMEGGAPTRVVHPRVHVEPHLVDLTQGGEDAERELQTQMRAESRRPFVLGAAPLFRCVLYRVAENEHVVLFVLHHIISDGWSMAVMLRELAALYKAARDQAPSPLTPPVLQYSDFAAWEQKQWAAGAWDKHLDYWLKQLADAPAILDLPTDRPRPAVQDFDGAVFEFQIPAELVKGVADIARRYQATPFMVLLAVYNVLLSRYTRQKDICVGTAVAGRTRRELEELIGFFVNTLVLRTNLQNEPTFDDLLKQVRENTLSAFAHQELPFVKLVESLALDRDRSHPPVFQAALVYQNTPEAIPAGGDLQIEPIPIDNGAAKYDLTVIFWETKHGGLTGQIEYRTSLFNETTITRMAASFQTLLGAALNETARPVSQLAILDETQRRQVVQEWNRTEKRLPPPYLLHALFEEQVALRPDKVALRCHGASMSYAELNARANSIAKGLQLRGVQVETPVAVGLERSFELVAAMLGVLKAGGVYVPLDMSQPAGRLANVISDVGASLLVTNDATKLDRDIVTTVSVEQLDTEGAAARDAIPVRELNPHNLAYVIYTSGSTGVPKGVQIEHQGIVAFVRGQKQIMGVTEHDRTTFLFSPCFDGSISEIFLALANGGTLAILDRETVLDPPKLMDLLEQEEVTAAKFPPALLEVLSESRMPLMRTVLSAGDALSSEIVRRWIQGRRLFNGYGPTETAVGACIMELRDASAANPPLGPPMPNKRVYVLDEHRQPVPVGAPGEIYIGGLGVARGYVNQPQLTEERFLPDPFARNTGRRASGEGNSEVTTGNAERMYRTGDLGRWREDGVIEFLGRVDQQVKIRGYRIETGEIASVLTSLPEVEQAVVVPREDSPGNVRLIAYVVPAEASRESQSGFEQEHVETWRALFDQAQQLAAPVLDPEMNIAGWMSSYDGQPIPREQMQRWIDRTVAQVLELKPRRVLEIGCGTGLLLFRIAPHCETYVGTDFLNASLQYIENVLERREDLRAKVRLEERTADRLGDFETDGFDVVILNSVAQYFPSLDYLLTVIDGAARLVRPGGHLFLGDLRSLPLQEALATSIECFKSDQHADCASLRQRVQARMAREEELLIDPALFSALAARLPRVSEVEVRLKQGGASNELTRFRYDVLIKLGDHEENPWRSSTVSLAPEILDWGKRRVTPAQMAQQLNQCEGKPLVLRGVLNPRVACEMAIWRQLQKANDSTTLAELRNDVEANLHGDLFDPDEFVALEEVSPYRIIATWSDEAADRYDVLFRPLSSHVRASAESPRSAPDTPLASRSSRGERIDWSKFTNDPLADKVVGRLVPQLRKALQAKLPEYMMPASFVLLDHMPLTISGKIDRNALPSPPNDRPSWATTFVAPRNDHERILAEVWERLLGVHPVGVTDNFFELGGHSMLAVRVMADIQRQVGVTLPLAALFQQPTIEHLASLLESPHLAEAAASLVPLQLEGEGTPLFLVHPAGGTVFCYLELARYFRGERPVYGLQALGVDGIHPPHTRVEDMCAHYIAAMRRVQPSGPYYLAGWSLGGNLAYEMARQLAAEGQEVAKLILMDSGALPADRPIDESEFLALIVALFPGEEHRPLDEVQQMSPEEQLEYFVHRAAQAGLVRTDDIAAGQHVFRVFQSNMKATLEYRPGPYSGNIVLLRAAQQQKTNDVSDDPYLGWGQLALGGVEVREVPGDHAHMVHEPNVARLAAEVKHALRDG